ncbi:MAG: hypothetical protein WA705_10520 [Candidatus Ozemobacteraceae bacterium]
MPRSLKERSKAGIALAVVLGFSTTLLVMGMIFLQTNRHSRPVNERIYERTQADFLAQGLVELATLKFKKRPAEFYWAYKIFPTNDAPFKDYQTNDPTLNGTFTDAKGNNHAFTTQWELVTDKLYDYDGIQITVNVTTTTVDGISITRKMVSTVSAKRTTLSS